MGRGLTPTEFMEAALRKWAPRDAKKITPKQMRCAWDAFLDLMIEELIRYGYIDLPRFGKIIAKETGGRYLKMPLTEQDRETYGYEGNTKEVYLDCFLSPRFSFSAAFVDVLNGRAPTTLEKVEIANELALKAKIARKKREEEQRRQKIAERRVETYEKLRAQKHKEAEERRILALQKIQQSKQKEELNALVNEEKRRAKKEKEKDDYGY